IGAPVHSLGLAPVTAFQDATGPAHFIADAICPPCRSIPQFFTLRGIGQPVAMTARKDCPAVEDGNPATTATGRAEEPMPLAAYVAGRGVEIDGIAFGLPFPTSIPVAIVQDHAPR